MMKKKKKINNIWPRNGYSKLHESHKIKQNFCDADNNGDSTKILCSMSFLSE